MSCHDIGRGMNYVAKLIMEMMILVKFPKKQQSGYFEDCKKAYIGVMEMSMRQ